MFKYYPPRPFNRRVGYSECLRHNECFQGSPITPDQADSARGAMYECIEKSLATERSRNDTSLYIALINACEVYIDRLDYIRTATGNCENVTTRMSKYALENKVTDGMCIWTPSPTFRDKSNRTDTDMESCYLSYAFEQVMTCTVAETACINTGEIFLKNREYAQACAYFLKTLIFSSLAKEYLRECKHASNIREMQLSFHEGLAEYVLMRAQDSKFRMLTQEETGYSLQDVGGHYVYLQSRASNAFSKFTERSSYTPGTSNMSAEDSWSVIARVTQFMRMYAWSMAHYYLHLQLSDAPQDNQDYVVIGTALMLAVYFCNTAVQLILHKSVKQKLNDVCDRCNQRSRKWTNEYHSVRSKAQLRHTSSRLPSLAQVSQCPIMYCKKLPKSVCLITDDVAQMKAAVFNEYVTGRSVMDEMS